jgi:FemAB-related protein (PEP-CTERM system-associated)
MTPGATTTAATAAGFAVSDNERSRPGTPGTHLAHDPAWLEIIQHAYGHQPLVLRTQDEHGQAYLPAILIRRPLVGAVAASMPFLDGGGPVAASPRTASVLVERLVSEARALGARAVHVRTAETLDLAWTPESHKVNLTLPLAPSPDELWARVGGSVRNEVRKAQRSGLTVEQTGVSGLGAFYEIHAARMRDLGSPAHARRFFEAVFSTFGSRARLFLVRRQATNVGGLIALGCGNTVTVPWASCLREHFPLCPNMLLYWETIRTACSEGFQHFDFGRSTKGSGTWRFKRQWGAVEQPLFWYWMPLTRLSRRQTNEQSHVPTQGHDLLAAAWRRLPAPVTGWLGPRLRGFMVQ